MNRRNNNGKKKTRNPIPSWLEGKRTIDGISSTHKSESRIQQLQQRRSGVWSGDTTNPERRSGRSGRESNQCSQSRSEDEKQRSKTTMDDGTQVGRIRRLEYHFSMQQLRESLSDSTLQQLINNDFDPIEIITITKIEQTKFAEDDYFPAPPKRKSPTKKNIKKIVPLSEQFKTDVAKFTIGKLEGSPEIVLGVYFDLYKRLFHEEDPQWADKSITPAISTIRTMAIKVADGNYKNLVIFLRKIMPLWKQRLIENQQFPNSRPTIEALFGGKRYFWANRKVLYKKWQTNKL